MRPFLLTLGSAGVTMSSLFLVGLIPSGGLMLQSQICMALIGIPVAGIMILPPAILSDVIDYDEQLTGQRREGIYVGVSGHLPENRHRHLHSNCNSHDVHGAARTSRL